MRLSRGFIRAGCLTAAALCIALAATRSRAAEMETRSEYNLPARDLAESLRAIARASGKEIMFASEAVGRRRAPEIRRRLTLRQAIDNALSGTGLVAEYRGDAILVRPPSGAEAEAPPATDPAITVTGTRIRGAASASPVTVDRREALENAGITDMAGYARYLVQNFTGGQNPGVAGGGQQGGYNNINNSTSLNLRGLGPDATLTLVNGHRLAYDAVIQGVDISAIPLIAVDRVELITDGASALYGSDAVGGVANIILRRDHEGLTVTGRAGATTAGGGRQQQVSAIGGRRWTSGGFMLAFDASRSTPILASDRGYAGSVNGSQSLITRNAQASLLLVAHQKVGDAVELTLDGLALGRRSQKSNAFSVATDVFTSGLYNRPKVETWSINPGLRLSLPGGWEGNLLASHGSSRTDIFGERYANRVRTPARVSYVNRLDGLEAGAEGPLIHLPGGEARLAVGGGLRALRLDTFNQILLGGILTTNRHTIGRRRSVFAYGELSLPLIAPGNALPLVDSFSISAALRYERHRESGAVATPKFGIIYQPLAGVRVTGSWGRSFKSPTLFQTSQLVAGNVYSSSLFVQPVPPFPAGSTVMVLDGGNPDLAPERATTWTAGVELRPWAGLELEISGFDVNYTGRVGFPVASTLAAFANPIYGHLILRNPTAAQVQAVIAGLSQGVVNQSGRPFDLSSITAILDETLRNTAHERARGVDLAARYGFDLGTGRFSLDAAASYLESRRQLAEGQPVLQRAGLVFNPPHWRGRLTAGWQNGRFGATALVTHLGATRDDRFALARVGSFTTFDLSARISGGAEGPLAGWELRLTALNLLAEKPAPIRNTDPTAVPYDSTNHSPVGRFLGASVTKSW